MPSERDISTDRINRVLDAHERRQQRQTPSGSEIQAFPCSEHASRLAHLEAGHSELRAVCIDHEKRLHAGDLGFLDMRKDIQALAKAVEGAVEQMKLAAAASSRFDWGTEVKRAIISWGVPVAILVGVWALVSSGAVHIAKALP